MLGMVINVPATVKTLVTHLRAALDGTAEETIAAPLLDAIEGGRLHFEREPWYDVAASLTNLIYSVSGELLLRAHDADGRNINQQEALQAIARHHLYPLFDRLVTLSAIEQTIRADNFPVSINISSRNAVDDSSLLELHHALQHHFAGQFHPNQIIFEFLEDDQAEGVNEQALLKMTALGYRFAIDDQSHEDADAARLQNLGRFVEYVKIDGNSLVAARQNQVDLGNFVERIQKAAPAARILCEWVDSAEDAGALNEKHPLISLVQGRNLGHDPAEFTRRIREADALNIAAQNNLPKTGRSF
jgi:EAL domain-containing protein (putative c-di-GMP-specific phosphodiesterase class I)